MLGDLIVYSYFVKLSKNGSISDCAETANTNLTYFVAGRQVETDNVCLMQWQRLDFEGGCMSSGQERLHIDELKRVEKQAGTLMKMWRKLSKDHAMLQSRYEKLQIRVEKLTADKATQTSQLQSEHSQTLAQLESQWQTRLTETEQTYQQRYDDNDQRLRTEIDALTSKQEQTIQELQQQHDKEQQALEERLQLLQYRYQTMIDRVRGIEE